ncbi:Hsp20/alpha crystallin family protein [Fictibacillus sp. Mic-4]|uniref:Hsp20/alpha crystallin family protein n=1 Tax=Fictibacillus TaxID=1329200 RepID=UPI00041AC960|nr:Hsp20/alpha crystallin family protein [Fictibacillus gelatini]
MSEGPLSPFFNDKSLSSWIKSLEEFIDKSFQQYNHMIEKLSFPVDVYESKDTYVIQAQLPDYHRDHIHLEVLERAIRIMAHASDGTELVNDKTNFSQFSQAVRRTERVIPLPFPVSQDDVRATFGNGILKIYVKKKRATNYIDVEPEFINEDD